MKTLDLYDYDFLFIEEFNRLAKENKFKEGPFITMFSSRELESCVFERAVWGILIDGRKVKSLRKEA